MAFAPSTEFLNELRGVVGQEHVLTSPEALARYSRCTIPWQRQCAAVVFPGSTPEVAAILAAANRHRKPVWPVSGGRNWGYGASLAPEGGLVVMVLSRMNRILEINEELAYAVIEPGVSYRQLNDHLKEKGYRLWIDTIDGTAHGSVIGNALERGVGETPYGDHFGNLCGLEVVLPTGEIIHTGGQAAGGPATWHLHKWGVGPYLEGLFSQSNFGVVTRAGIWLMPEPEAYNAYVLEIPDETRLPAVLDAFRRLALDGIVDTKLHLINDFVSLTVLTQRAREAVPQAGPLTPEARAGLRRKYGIAPWSCAGGIYGTTAQVRLQRRLLRRALGRHGRLLFVGDGLARTLERALPALWRRPWLARLIQAAAGPSLPLLETVPQVHRILQGIPTEFFVRHAYYRCRSPRPDRDVDPARDRCGLIWFAPILPFTPGHVMPYLEQCRQRFQSSGFDFYMAMLLMNPRAVICLQGILYDREDPDETARAQALFGELLEHMARSGYQQYRAGLESWPGLWAGTPELAALHGRLKAALDPQHVLAPGRYGIP